MNDKLSQFTKNVKNKTLISCSFEIITDEKKLEDFKKRKQVIGII